MHSKKRIRNVARPRQVAMALAKELTQLSLPEIGEPSAAATTRPCCTPAARSRRCARQDTGARTATITLLRADTARDERRATRMETALWITSAFRRSLAGIGRTTVHSVGCTACARHLLATSSPLIDDGEFRVIPASAASLLAVTRSYIKKRSNDNGSSQSQTRRAARTACRPSPASSSAGTRCRSWRTCCIDAATGAQLEFLATDLEIQITAQRRARRRRRGASVTVGARKLLGHPARAARRRRGHARGAGQAHDGAGRQEPLQPADAAGGGFSAHGRGRRTTSTTLHAAAEGADGRCCGLVQFAMAQQDIRYYLNGMLLVVDGQGHAAAWSRPTATACRTRAMALDGDHAAPGSDPAAQDRARAGQAARPTATTRDARHRSPTRCASASAASSSSQGGRRQVPRLPPRDPDRTHKNALSLDRAAAARSRCSARRSCPTRNSAACGWCLTDGHAEDHLHQHRAGRGRGRARGRLQRRRRSTSASTSPTCSTC